MARVISNKDAPSGFAVPTRPSAGSPVKERPFLLLRYIKSLVKRIYRPIKPIVNPLVKKIKIIYILIVLLIIGMIGNYQYWQEKKIYQQELKQKTIILQKISIFEQELEKKPNYRDVLLKLALLNFQIKEIEKAKNYWDKANYLDPNSKSVQQVGKIIFPTQL